MRLLSVLRFRLPFDAWLFLLCIPAISAFNYALTYTHIRLNGFLALTFTLDTLQGWLAWLAVRYAIRRMDRAWPVEQWGWKRVLWQLGLTTGLGLLIISLLTELVSWVARGRGAPQVRWSAVKQLAYAPCNAYLAAPCTLRSRPLPTLPTKPGRTIPA